MRLSIDLDTREVRTWAGAAVASLVAKRRDRFLVEVRFTRGGVVQELGSGASGKLGVKALDAFTAAYLAAALSWVKSGTGTSTVYTFDLNVNTVEVGTAFAADPATIDAAIEIEWLVGNYRQSSLSIPLELANDYVRGDETAPTDAAPDLAGWGNSAFRFGSTGEPEFYNADLAAWVRMTFAGSPPQQVFTVL